MVMSLENSSQHLSTFHVCLVDMVTAENGYKNYYFVPQLVIASKLTKSSAPYAFAADGPHVEPSRKSSSKLLHRPAIMHVETILKMFWYTADDGH